MTLLGCVSETVGVALGDGKRRRRQTTTEVCVALVGDLHRIGAAENATDVERSDASASVPSGYVVA